MALLLALELQPSHILTDSLVSLHLLQSWGTWSTQRTLQNPDRALVRHVIHQANQLASLPLLEKVKAHDDQALAMGHPKAVGNDAADTWAKRAATETGHTLWSGTTALHDDPVIAVDRDGLPVRDFTHNLAKIWWERRHRSTAQARPLLEWLYPRDVDIAWGPSTSIFRRPVVQNDVFIHPVAPAVIKWMARLRTGALATRLRLWSRGMIRGSAVCGCCNGADEDEEHLMVGCTATGAADWQVSILEVWRAVARGLSVAVPDPPNGWLEDHRFMLVAALLPASLAVDCGVPTTVAPRFLARLHPALATATAERLRRRGELLGQATRTASSSPPGLVPPPSTSRPVGSLPVERQLTVREIRRVEAARRADPPTPTTLPVPVGPPRAPLAGDARRRWLRQRLLAVLQDDMNVCTPEQGVESVAVLELFERVTGEAFADTPGTRVGQRVRGIAKVLGNICREEELDPPFTSTTRVRHSGRMQLWNRQPRDAVDVQEWRRRVEAVEVRAVPVPRLRDQMASADAGLAAWIHNHRYLVPTDAASGESGMALLLLWEVDHQKTFPTKGSEGVTAALGSFTKRLQLRVAKDPRLSWLTAEDMAAPLAPGLAPTHHKRWSVRVMAPPADEPQGWYTDFVARWRAYTEALVCPPGSRPMSELSEDLLTRVRPGLRQLGGAEAADAASSSSAMVTSLASESHSSTAAIFNPRQRFQGSGPTRSPARTGGPATPRMRRPRLAGAGQPPEQALARSPACTPEQATPRTTRSRAVDVGTSPSPQARRAKAPARLPVSSTEPATTRPIRPREVDVALGPPTRRQCTLLAWLRPPAAPTEDPAGESDRSAARHGRATAGPPT